MAVTRTCRYEPCSGEFTPTHPRQEFCEPSCKANQHYVEHPEKGRVLQGGALRSVATHPLADARAKQEESETNKQFGLLIRQAIIDQIRTTGTCHADDLEPLYPSNEVERRRCRKLAGAQFGSLASSKLIREKERRKSSVPERKGAKSGVFEFTKAGWDKYGRAGVSAGLPSRGSAEERGEAAGIHSGDAELTGLGGGAGEASSHGFNASTAPPDSLPSTGSSESQDPKGRPSSPSPAGAGEPARLFPESSYEKLQDVA